MLFLLAKFLAVKAVHDVVELAESGTEVASSGR